MRWQWSLLALALLSSPGMGQEPLLVSPVPASPLLGPGERDCAHLPVGGSSESDPLDGNRNFPNFIGFMSNPLQSIDPRALTQLWPIVGSAWVSGNPALPKADFQIYGAGLNVALSDRFSFGLNQGGYANIHVTTGSTGILGGKIAALPPGDRQGFLNLGGFAQYTLIEDVENQFLMTAGMRLEVPCGSYEVFQGHGPVHLAPYVTVGKEIEHFHLLATAGYQFPAAPLDA